MAYTPTGMQALFPIYLARMATPSDRQEAFDSAVAQNENNLNQNFELIYNKLLALETALAASEEGETP
ncbi:MAG: hypothetical protein IJK01_08855 [Clostridia bacterium]|nr:hypothetical protein [Clostridia bacterium]